MIDWHYLEIPFKALVITFSSHSQMVIIPLFLLSHYVDMWLTWFRCDFFFNFPWYLCNRHITQVLYLIRIPRWIRMTIYSQTVTSEMRHNFPLKRYRKQSWKEDEEVGSTFFTSRKIFVYHLYPYHKIVWCCDYLTARSYLNTWWRCNNCLSRITVFVKLLYFLPFMLQLFFCLTCSSTL